MVLRETNAYTFAKEATMYAIQNNLIPIQSTPKETGEAVADFFNALADRLILPASDK